MEMHKPLRDPGFWHAAIDGITIAHLVAEKLIKHARTGNKDLYENVLSLAKIAS